MRKFFWVLLILLSLHITQPVSAQATGPIYIVQSGDTLSFIASRFNVNLADLINANPSIDPNLLAAGQEIVIPGLEGVTGVLETEIISFGDTLRSLSRRTQVADDQLRKLNRIVSPTELYAGISLILPLQEGQQPLTTRLTPLPGESMLELAIRNGSDPWTISSLNKRMGPWDILPGDVLYSLTNSNSTTIATGLPSAFLSADISPLPLKQGSTEAIQVVTQGGWAVSGTLVDQPLNFFPAGDDGQVALQGVHALLEPGLYPLYLEVTLPDGGIQSFEQMILVTSGNYLSEEISVPPETIDPVVSESENKTILSVVSPSSPAKFWNAIFTSPSESEFLSSRFGTRRTYHGIGTDLIVEGFHTGLDFEGGEGLQIFAPAPGKVVFAAPLIVRGNATIIDHGWGVYSGFWHQSQMLVNVGDVVEQGQVIGLVGGTGRVTGAHLHWEVWANGVQVNPLDWLERVHP